MSPGAVSLAAAVALLSAAPRVQQPPPLDLRALALNQPVERALTGSEIHGYQIRLAHGEVAVATVTQRGIDVVLELVDTDNKSIAEADDEPTSQGTEKIALVADRDGDYTLRIKPKLKTARGRYEICLVDVRTATPIDRTRVEVRSLMTRSHHLVAVDKFAEGLPLAKSAVDLARQALGPGDAMVGLALINLGEAQQQHDVPDARKAFGAAVPILTGALGPDHPQTLWAKSRLASTCARLGEVAEADRLLAEVFEAEERTFAPNEPLMAKSLMTRAILSSDRADYARAERDDKRALAIFEANGLTDVYEYAEVLNNLGVVYARQDRYDEERPYLERALACYDKKFGPESFAASYTLNNLGVVARQQKDYAAAERYYLTALAIKEKFLGKDSSEYSAVLMNLANVYSSAGDYPKALDTHLRALHIVQRISGPYESRPILSLANVARSYAALGDFKNANIYQAQLEAALDTDTALNIAIGSEEAKLAYLGNLAQRTDRTISLHLQLEPDDPDAAALAATVVLRRKGRLLDAMTDMFAELRKHAGPHTQVLLDELNTTTAQFARVALGGPQKKQSIEAHRRIVQELQEQKEKLEAEISRENANVRTDTKPVTLAAVQAVIPRDAALLEFVSYRPFDVRAQTNAEQYGPRRYAAYVLLHDGNAKGIDLGPEEQIDRAIREFRASLGDSHRTDVERLSRRLTEKVLDPVLSLAPREARLLISPDGQLDLVPFGALVDARGQYLVERYSITYLTSGRDLLQMQVRRRNDTPPVIIADPSFGAGDPVTASQRTSQRASTGALSGVYFVPLPQTSEEARTLKTLFPRAQVLTGERASKSMLESVAAPSILHIATHGFFLPDADHTSAANRRNPLLRAGLALRGANAVAHGSNEGVLTALEASRLDLWGTKLVTLSACDTGVGEVKNGEGVYGLRRAFFVAGAESEVVSLWSVSDSVTRRMMTAYYNRLKNGLGRGEALRQSQLEIRRKYPHPFYWASFIQSGDWTPIR